MSTSDAAKHMGAAMASYGSTPLFHIVGVTPECDSLTDVAGDNLPIERITEQDIAQLRGAFGAAGETVDVVVFAAPQLSLVEMQSVAELCRGRKLHPHTSMLVGTPASVYVDAQQAGFIEDIENFGARFYQQYAREIGEANSWTRLLSNSTKIVNIPGGYGYKSALASMALANMALCDRFEDGDITTLITNGDTLVVDPQRGEVSIENR